MPADTRQIYVSFPVAVELSREDERDLHDLVGRICKRHEKANPGRVMWAAGYGGLCTSMPITAEDEAAGVPLEFDMSVLHIEVAEREDYKWPCAKCGQRQDEHDHVVLKGKAEGCEFEPAEEGPKKRKAPKSPAENLTRFADDLEAGGSIAWTCADGKQVEVSSRAIASDLRVALRALAAPAEARSANGGWQPIETAPKDGTEVLCTALAWMYGPDRFSFIGFWKHDQWLARGEDDTWWEPYPPTHWQPLPTPPKAEA